MPAAALRRFFRVAQRLLFAAIVLAASLMISRAASAQSVRPDSLPELQGIWDFNMRLGERTSPGFLALGPLEKGWGGSITMYLTNTLAIRELVVKGDSVRMVVASREGDVRYLARLSNGGRTMEGIVEYHGGALVPMTAVRRVQPVLPR